MVRIRRALALVGLALAARAVVVRARPGIDDIRRSLRTSSSPGARAYAALAGVLLGGYYRDIAADCTATLSGSGPASVLEIGPGPGHLAEHLLRLRPDVRWTGLDIDPAMLDAARGRLASAGVGDRAILVEGDVAALPFEDATFDLVVSSLSAHHWPDADAGFREIRRVLRPGATALVYDLPETWGQVETGSRGIGAADAAFTAGESVTFRGLGPLTLVRRARLRVPLAEPALAEAGAETVRG